MQPQIVSEAKKGSSEAPSLPPKKKSPPPKKAVPAEAKQEALLVIIQFIFDDFKSHRHNRIHRQIENSRYENWSC